MKRNTPRKWLFRLVSVLLTVGLMALVLAYVDWENFGELITRISLSALVIALAAYFAQNFFRAVRFRVLLNRADLALRHLLPITLYHNLLVRVLPFKLGELSYVVLLKTRLNLSVESGVSSLVGARLFELMIVVITCATGFLFSGQSLDTGGDQIALFIVVTFLVSVIALYYAGALTRAGVRVIIFIAERLIGRVPPRLSVGLGRLRKLAQEFDTIRQPRLFLAAVGLSVLTNLSSIILNITLMMAVGVSATLPQFLAIVGLGQFAMAFPFSVSGFGVVEGSWALGLVTFAGYSVGDAAAVGLLLHSFQIMSATLYGLIGWALIRVIPAH